MKNKNVNNFIKQQLITFLFASLFTATVSANTQEELTQHANTFQKGYELAQTGKYEQALKTWKALAQKDNLVPELQRALQNNIAVILMQKNEYQAAKEELDKALKADAQVATTLANLNKLYAYDAQQAYKKVFKDTKVAQPQGELLYFDVKRAKTPTTNVITDINQADAITIVKKRVENWRKAWSGQDIEAYLSFYDPQSFIPKKGMDFASWKKSRYRSVLGPKFINVKTGNLKAVKLSENLVRVNFYQSYASDRFKDSINKVMLWSRADDGQWKITQEIVVYGKE